MDKDKDKKTDMRGGTVLEQRSQQNCCFEVRSEPDKPTRISGYAVIFDEETTLWEDGGYRGVERISKEAYTQEKADGADIKMTLFHNREKLLARSENGSGSMAVTVDDKGVRFEFEVPDTEYGKFAAEAIRRGDIKGCSFGFFCNRTEYSRDARTDYYVRKDIDIKELTLESDPAYQNTSCEVRRKRNEEDGRTSEADALKLRRIEERAHQEALDLMGDICPELDD